jgi:hypothetical protein
MNSSVLSAAWRGLWLAGLVTAAGTAPGAAAPLPLDLAGQAHRQVVVDRQPGQYLGHPSTLLLEDGQTILCVYPQGHGRGAIVYKRSLDGGRTWSERLPTPASWATSQETPTLHRVVSADGRKRVLLWSGLYPARRAVSEDDGRTWSELAAAGEWGGIVVMGSVFARRDSPGSYVAMFHDDGRYFAAGGMARGTFTLYQTRSHDGGLSWAQPVPILAGAEMHLCEPGVVRSPDGRQVAALLRENRRKKPSQVIFSDDEGQTWTSPQPLHAALTGDRHTARYAPDGRLVVSFRDMAPASPTRGDWVAWVGKYEELASGGPGQYRVRLMDNLQGTDCAYPGVERLPDGTFVLTTYGHWTAGEAPYLVSVRLRLEELDNMAPKVGRR